MVDVIITVLDNHPYNNRLYSSKRGRAIMKGQWRCWACADRPKSAIDPPTGAIWSLMRAVRKCICSIFKASGKIITFASRKLQASLLGEFATVYNIEYFLEKKINAFLLTFFCCSQYPRAFHATKLYPKCISAVYEGHPNHPSTRCACNVK